MIIFKYTICQGEKWDIKGVWNLPLTITLSVNTCHNLILTVVSAFNVDFKMAPSSQLDQTASRQEVKVHSIFVK